MRKYFPVLFRVVFVGLLLPAIASAQSPNYPKPKGTRHVKGRVLTSTSLPPIRIKIDKAFKYVGSQSFILYDRAQVHQPFFVNPDNRKRIKRRYMMHFKDNLPKIKATYDYPVTKTVNLRGPTYIVNAQG